MAGRVNKVCHNGVGGQKTEMVVDITVIVVLRIAVTHDRHFAEILGNVGMHRKIEFLCELSEPFKNRGRTRWNKAWCDGRFYEMKPVFGIFDPLPGIYKRLLWRLTEVIR